MDLEIARICSKNSNSPPTRRPVLLIRLQVAEGLFQIRDQVFDVFDAGGVAHHAFRDAGCSAFLGSAFDVAGGNRWSDYRFDTT
jgi:hypothetical protein